MKYKLKDGVNFTLVNKKEKVVKKARSGYAVDEFICLNCGNRFR